MEELKIEGYVVTRFVMHAIDDYEEVDQVLSVEEFDKESDKDRYLEHGLAAPLYAIPKGYAIVPVEPTTRMQYAAENIISSWCTSSRQSRHHEIARDAYSEMIKAHQEEK